MLAEPPPSPSTAARTSAELPPTPSTGARMSPEPPPTPFKDECLAARIPAATLSEKQQKKICRNAEKAEMLARRQRHQHQQQQLTHGSDDLFEANYGDIPLEEIQSKAISGRSWTQVCDLDAVAVGRSVLVRAAIQAIREVSNKMVFFVLRQSMSTVQCVLVSSADSGTSTQMVRFTASLSVESIVQVEGVVCLPKDPVKACTQKVEIQVRKIYCVNRAILALPINFEDLARSENEIEKGEHDGQQQHIRVGQDTRLNYRTIDLRIPSNQAIFRIECQVENKFREFLLSKGFVGIHTPKLIAGSSEGGAAVFNLLYNGQPACLAQSPQLHKQMAICGGFERVFEVGPVFRAENSHTHRHLSEFLGLDAEMEIKEHYFEVCDIVDGLFLSIFEHLNENCKEELEAINRQYPFEPLKYLDRTLKLTYDEGIQMFKDAGTEIDPMGDLNTDAEKKLGQLVKEKYGTDFFILHQYPLAVRPFYTMPCYNNPAYSNSFDVFIRGEDIISGAQRIHIPELLVKRAVQCGVDVNTISAYLESFSYGVPPHGGFGVGLERVVMLFCALKNIRKTSLFPRDPRRLVP